MIGYFKKYVLTKLDVLINAVSIAVAFFGDTVCSMFCFVVALPRV